MIFRIDYIVPTAIENAPFKIVRPEGSYRYIFFHFVSKVIMNINGEDVELNPGTCIVYSPGTRQDFHVETNRLNHDYIDFVLNEPGFFESIGLPLNVPFCPKISNYITNTVKNIAQEKSFGLVGAPYMADSMLCEFFVNISRRLRHRRHVTPDSYNDDLKAKFDAVRLALYQNPVNASVSSIAKEVGYSLPRCNALYKSYFGTTPMKDLTNARIAYVKEMIAEGKTTSEIIKSINFESPEYFYRWFKTHFGMTKEQYIASLGKTEAEGELLWQN